MKIWTIAAAISLSLLATPSFADESACAATACKGKDCGCELLKAGWRVIARCDGHEWSYVIEKGSERRLCTGISARAGREENPCTPFEGDLAKFKRCGKK